MTPPPAARPAAPHPWLALGFVVLISSAFALGSVLGRMTLDAGASLFTVNLLRTCGGAVTVAAYLGIGGRLPALAARRVRGALALGLMMAGYSGCLYGAIAVMPVGLATVTFYTWPLMVGAVAWATGSERLTWLWPVAAVMAMVGLLLALDVAGQTPSTLGIALALSAAVGWTVVLMLNRRLVGGGDSRPVTFHMMLAASAANALACLATGGLMWPEGTAGWIGLIGCVALYCFASVGTYIAAAITGPVRTALIMNVEPVVSLAAAAVILGQWLSALQVFGAVLVVASLLVARRASGPAGRG